MTTHLFDVHGDVAWPDHSGHWAVDEGTENRGGIWPHGGDTPAQSRLLISIGASDAVTGMVGAVWANIMVPGGKLILPNFCLNRDKLLPVQSHQTGNSGGSQVGSDVASPVVRDTQTTLNTQTIQITNNPLQNWVVASFTKRQDNVSPALSRIE